MHYPHSPHRTDYFTCYRHGDWKVIYHYFPSAVSRRFAFPTLQPGRRSFRTKNLVASHPAELRRMMQELIAGLEKQNAVYPVGQDGKTPVKPTLP